MGILIQLPPDVGHNCRSSTGAVSPVMQLPARHIWPVEDGTFETGSPQKYGHCDDVVFELGVQLASATVTLPPGVVLEDPKVILGAIGWSCPEL